MKLFLHIGTEKTGRSFLQTLAAKGRDDLRAKGIWFPKGNAYDEGCMRAGCISAGNGRELAQKIKCGQWAKLAAILKAARHKALAHNCHGVLVSSEHMLAPLSASGTLEKFHELLRTTCFDAVETLVILRDPVDQFLSLYKHRAKHGTVGSIGSWGEKGYDLPQILNGLRLGMHLQGIKLTARKYSRGDGELERIMFSDWLGVAPPQVFLPDSVNPSLSLWELVLLRVLAQERPDMVVPLYERLLKLDLDAKAQGQALEVYAKTVAAQTVAAHRAEWKAWNALLPEAERLVLPEASFELLPEPCELGFSRSQVEEMVRFFSRSATPHFLLKQFWTIRMRPMLGHAKRTLMGSGLK